jgi:UDP-3-O-[3-hydroxymyristoyl] N-acetylglucosamine deacetylase/3-hydroxyacyl-[acyl-carrier-protein] dehydratase
MTENQRTIARECEFEGVGIHTGEHVRLRFAPAPPGAGVVFVREDLPEKPTIPVEPSAARTDTTHARRTILERNGAQVHTVEHVLAAVAGLGIDNVRIHLDGLEVPEPECGSAEPFTAALTAAGVVEQDTPRKPLFLSRAVVYRDGEAEISAVPADELRLSYTIEFDDPLIGNQHCSLAITPDRFAREIAPCRTFALYRDVEALRAAGMIKGGTLKNALVVQNGKLLNDEPLRFRDEFVRHKILDLTGDLAILGRPLRAHVVALRAGHVSHLAFVRRLAREIRRASRPQSWVREPLTAYNKPQPRDPKRDGYVFDLTDILRIMPHRYPFLLVDRIVEMTPERIVGIKNVTINEPFFQGHFPGQPIMPGVLLIEAMAQVGGVMLLNTVADPEDKLVYFIGIDRARFRQAVTPGDQVRFILEPKRLSARICKMHGRAYVGDSLVVEADLMSSIVEP